MEPNKIGQHLIFKKRLFLNQDKNRNKFENLKEKEKKITWNQNSNWVLSSSSLERNQNLST